MPRLLAAKPPKELGAWRVLRCGSLKTDEPPSWLLEMDKIAAKKRLDYHHTGDSTEYHGYRNQQGPEKKLHFAQRVSAALAGGGRHRFSPQPGALQFALYFLLPARFRGGRCNK